MRVSRFLSRVSAMSALRRAYNLELAEMVDAILGERRRGVGTVMRLAHAYVGQHIRARSETCALETLLVSSHRDAWAAQGYDGDGGTFPARAYWTLIYDIVEALRARGEYADELPDA